MDTKEEILSKDIAQNDSESGTTAEVAPTSPSVTSDTLEQLKELIKSTVSEVLASSQTEQARKQAEEYNSKVAELVTNTQAKIIKPNIENGQRHLEYVNKVLKEDARMRLQNSDGRARYGQDPEGLTKAKIILLQKIGLKEEEIAKEIADLL